MQISNKQSHALNQILKGLLGQKQLADATHSAVMQQQPILHYLVNEKLIDSKIVAKAIATYFNLQFIDLTEYHDKTLAIEYIQLDQLQLFALLPLKKKQERLIVAISNPVHFQLIEDIKFKLNLSIQTVIAPYDQLTYFINRIIHDIFKKDYCIENSDIKKFSAVALINRIITDAVYRNASDIHFETMQRHYRIRIRIDGILHQTLQLRTEYASMISSRLKIMAALDISEKRLPQDGRFTFSLKTGLHRNCRLSTCPTLFGEKLVIRILSPQKHTLTINELGLTKKTKKIFVGAIRKPQGLILVTGPTGSGKSITLYTALNMLNDTHKNIVTIEDPIEIQLEGVNQVNINRKAGLDFSTALRAFLRQDPDTIMIGEIRDHETASMAIRAAQTGHLVLTTLHTNNAPEAVTRLVNMGVAPHSIASSLSLIVAQRLVRKICAHCQALGCQFCTDGYNGRIGIFELLHVTPNIKKLIAANVSANELKNFAKAEGMQTLWECALEKIKAGTTNTSEMIRVIDKY